MLGYRLRPLFRGRLGSHFLHFFFKHVTAEFLLNGFELLVEEVFTLLLIHVDFYLRLNLILQLDHLQIARNMLKHHLSPLAQIGHLEHRLLGGHVGVHVGRYKIDQERWAFNVSNGEACFGGNIGRLADNLQRDVLQRTHQGIKLLVALGRARFVECRNTSPEIRFLGRYFVELEAFFSLNDDRSVTIGHAQHL